MKALPHRSATRRSCASRPVAAGRCRTVRWLCCRVKATGKLLSAMRCTTVSICLYSVVSVRMNLRRAGVLKNRSRTSTVVPRGCATGAAVSDRSEPSPCTVQPVSASALQELSCNRDTEAILGSASPRNPRLPMRSRSSSDAILLVACRDSASDSSSRRNAAAVVAHPDALPAAILDIDLDAARTGIDAVLQQLLDDGGRPLDDLAGGDLVDQAGWQDLDGHYGMTWWQYRPPIIPSGAPAE